MYKNIFLTGKIQCGKSTLINEILNEVSMPYSGYRTLPYYEKEKKAGYYITEADPKSEVKDKISINTEAKQCIALVKGFSVTGVNILDNSIKDKLSKIILLDEIGVLEKCSTQFRERIIECLNSKKLLIGVLKKKEDEFLKSISERKDTLVIDIEENNNKEREVIKKQILEYIENILRCS